MGTPASAAVAPPQTLPADFAGFDQSQGKVAPNRYSTALRPQEESRFQSWVKQNKIPWQDSPTADYDMRGYWKAQQSGDRNAQQASNKHFPDTWKTPYHKTFSDESKYATPDAPHWQGSRLVDKSGKIVADESDQKTSAPKTLPANFAGFDSPAPNPVPQTGGSNNPILNALPLDAVNKYAVQPFDKMAEAGSRMGTAVADFPEAMNERLYPGQQARVRAAHPNLAAVGDVAQGISRGIASTAGGMVADPRNLPFLAASGPATLAKRAIGAGFGLMQAKGAVDQTKQAFNAPTSAGKAEAGTGAVINAIGALLGAHGAMRGEAPPVARPEIPAQAPAPPPRLYSAQQRAAIIDRIRQQAAQRQAPPQEPAVQRPNPAEVVSRVRAQNEGKPSLQSTESNALASRSPHPNYDHIGIDADSGQPILQRKAAAAEAPRAARPAPPTPADIAADQARPLEERGQAAYQAGQEQERPRLAEAVAKSQEDMRRLATEAQGRIRGEGNTKPQPQAQTQQGEAIAPQGLPSQTINQEIKAGELAGKQTQGETVVPIVTAKPGQPISEGLDKEGIANVPVPEVSPEQKAQVGKEYDHGNRTILQPTENEETNRKLALAAAPEIAQKIESATQGLEGIKYERLRPEKKPDRISQKAREGKPVSTIGDYGASQITFDSPDKKDVALDAIKKNFEVVGPIDDYLEKGKEGKGGYRAISIQVKAENGSTHEIQLVPKDVYSVNDESHVHYAKARDAKDKGDLETFKREQAISDRMNDEAYDKFVAGSGRGPDASSVRGSLSRGTPEITRHPSSTSLSAHSEVAVQQAAPSQDIALGSISASSSPNATTEPRSQSEGNRSQNAYSKGDRVSVNGKSGEVVYASPTMKIARVKFDEGGTRTVGLRELRSQQSAISTQPESVTKPRELSTSTDVSAKPVPNIVPGNSDTDVSELKKKYGIKDEPRQMVGEAPAPGKSGEMRVASIKQAPHKFQYKLNTDAEGVGTLLKEQSKYNPELAGVINVWTDPADGQTYVVNGHHRLELARRTGTESVTVRHIIASSEKSARALGAMQNIAEGRGTPIDAAKFLRDTGTTPEKLKAEGVSMGEATAAKGVALSKLEDSLFNKVVQGDLPVERAVAIGEATADHAEQKAISDLIDKQEAKGKRVTNDTLKELIRFVKGSEQKTETSASLFGEQEVSKSLALEKAEVSSYIKQQLAKDKKLFGFVSKGGRAEELERGNNIIDVKTSGKLATEATQGEEVYNKLSERAGPIADILDDAARRLADGESPNAVKQEAYDHIRGELSQALGAGDQRSSGERAGEPARASRQATLGGGEEKPGYRQNAKRGELDWAGGLTEDQLSAWSKSTSLKIEPAGEQDTLFGGAEKMYRFTRNDSEGAPERALIKQSQIEKLVENNNQRVIKALRKAGMDVPWPEREEESAGSPKREEPAQAGLFAKGTTLGAHTPISLANPKVWREAFPSTTDWIKGKVAESVSPADVEKMIVRQRTGELARVKEQTQAELKTERARWDKAGKEQSLKFIDNIESGKQQANSPDAKLAGTLREMLDDGRKAIQSLGTGKLEHFIEDYFPHIWEKPSEAGKIINRIMGKRPLQGTASFLKQRTIPTTAEGIEAGLKPVTYNPVDLALLKIHEMNRYIAAHKILGDMKQRGIAQFVRFGQKAPEGWTKLNDSMFHIMSPSDEGMVIRGDYYAPKEAADVLHNYLSPGLSKYEAYRVFRSAENTLNQAQLGISAFHLGTTSVNAMVSDMALGIKQLSHLDPKGFVTAARFPISPIRTYLLGRNMMGAYLDPESYAKYAKLADAVAEAGGRAKQDSFYQTDWGQKADRLWKDGNYVKAAGAKTAGLLQSAGAPIMEHIVPRMKLGAFADLGKEVFAQAEKENWDADKTKREMQKAWDSVDNRMGQLVYDNIFVPKAMKDLGMVSLRSLGWNLGTVREIGGGLKDIGKQIARTAVGEKPEVTDRMAYTLALPVVVGTLGGIYHYMHTGQMPQEAKDYFFPKTGRKDSRGDEERVSFPSYMKDVYSFAHNPVSTVEHKVNPMVSAMIDVLNNEDFYGTEIQHPDDPLVKRGEDVLKFALKQFEPFSYRNIRESVQRGQGGAAALVQNAMGITPAPGYINRSPAEELASEYNQKTRPQGPRTTEMAERSQRRREYEEKSRQGKVSGSDLLADVKTGKLTFADAVTIKKQAKADRLVEDFKGEGVDIPAAIKIWEAASDEEKERLRPHLAAKARQLVKYLPEQREQMRQKLKDALGSEKPSYQPPQRNVANYLSPSA